MANWLTEFRSYSCFYFSYLNKSRCFWLCKENVSTFPVYNREWWFETFKRTKNKNWWGDQDHSENNTLKERTSRHLIKMMTIYDLTNNEHDNDHVFNMALILAHYCILIRSTLGYILRSQDFRLPFDYFWQSYWGVGAPVMKYGPKWFSIPLNSGHCTYNVSWRGVNDNWQRPLREHQSAKCTPGSDRLQSIIYMPFCTLVVYQATISFAYIP